MRAHPSPGPPPLRRRRAPFVELLMFLFCVFWGMFHVNSSIIFLLLFMVPWVPISATLCRRAVLTLWHAFVFLGLIGFSLFFLLIGSLRCFIL
jgi:hypothetical protein